MGVPVRKSKARSDSWSTVSPQSQSAVIGHQSHSGSHRNCGGEGHSVSFDFSPSRPQHHQPLTSPAASTPARKDSKSSSNSGMVQPMELEESVSSLSGGASWTQRVPWLRNTRHHATNFPEGDAVYYGGFMEVDVHPSLSAASSQFSEKQQQQQQLRAPVPMKKQSSFQRIASWLTGSSREDEDSLEDFDENEWTPPDSSYGAAIPVGGWIPKNIRRGIEATLIGIMIVGLVFLVVTTSIRVTEDAKNMNNNTSSNGGSSGGIQLDDDRYIEYRDDDAAAVANADDDQVFDDDAIAAVDDAIVDDAYVADDAFVADDDAFAADDANLNDDAVANNDGNDDDYHEYVRRLFLRPEV